MTSSRPYLIRALYEWINDNGLTPYILVDAGMEGVEVPRQHVNEDKIVLNIAPRAISDLQISNESVSFNARFSGAAMTVFVPTQAVMAIYAMENGQGMVFAEDGGDNEPSPTEPGGDKPGRPSLRVVK